MVLDTEKLQEISKKILEAVDTNSTLLVSSSLELETKNNKLFLNITNKEYYVSISIDLSGEVEEFRAVVDAILFLNLISKITTQTIELTINKEILIIKGNGTYKLPMITDTEGLITVPEIIINNVTNEFVINNEDLQNILNFNTKEVTKNVVLKPVQKMYYVDKEGCITFTNSACINNFTLDADVKLLFNLKVVKLFKLLKGDKINVKLGFDKVGNTIQSKITFIDNDVIITSILLNDETLINSVPVSAIRGRANKVYPYNVTLKRTDLIEALNRISLFIPKTDAIVILSFEKEGVKLLDLTKNNNDYIIYPGTNLEINEAYTMGVDLVNFKSTLEGCTDEFINLAFGDDKAIVMTRGNIKNVIPHMIIS